MEHGIHDEQLDTWLTRAFPWICLNFVLLLLFGLSSSFRFFFWTLLGIIGCLIYGGNASVQHNLFPVSKRQASSPIPVPSKELDAGGFYELDLTKQIWRYQLPDQPYDEPFVGFHTSGCFEAEPAESTQNLRVVTWNIECGFKLTGIIEHLKKLKPDILFLQEVDINCVRSGSINVANEIAFALKLPYLLFANEGPVNHGAQGNAIISRYPFSQAWVHNIPCAKIGGCGNSKVHACPCALVQTPIGLVHVRCLHFDAYRTGIRGRLSQWKAVAEDIQANEKSYGTEMMICAGDLNTMANGVKRYQPWFCCDDLRWGSIGFSESEWFYKYALKSGAEWNDPTMGMSTHCLLGGLLSAEKIDWMILRGLEKVPMGSTYQPIALPGRRNDELLIAGDDASDHRFIAFNIEPKVQQRSKRSLDKAKTD